MSREFARYKVTGAVVDNGDWVLLPVELEAASSSPPGAGDVVVATFQGRGGVQVLTAGFGLLGGGAGGEVTMAVDTSAIAVVGHKHGAADIDSGTLHIDRVPVGTTSSTVCAGNDARLTNARVPIDGSVTTVKIASSAVTNSKLASMPASTFKGRDATGAGAPQDLTASEVRAILGIADSVNADWNATSGAARILNKPATFPPSAHNHDDRYYSEAEVNGLLDAKASLAGASFSGNVGIGVASPQASLHVNGSLRATWLTDGTTTKTITDVLAGSQGGAQSLATLADVYVNSFDYPATDNRFLQYKAAVGKWVSSGDGGLISIGALPLGQSWPQQTIGWYVDQRAPKASPAFTGSATIAASSGVPLTITNTGSDNSFVVNDQSSDSTPFVINAAGRVGVGVSQPLAELHVGGTVRCTGISDGMSYATIESVVGALSNARRATHIDQKLTPSAATAGSVGQLYWDDNYIYVRTAVGWKRAQLLGLDEAPASGGGFDQVKLTQAQYDALAVKDPDTLYVIVP